VSKSISSSNPFSQSATHRTGAVRFADPLVPEARFSRTLALGSSVNRANRHSNH
jgi:hypothetical protein